MRELILASASERRRNILNMCGIAFEAVVSDASEDMDASKHVSDLVKINAARKAEAVSADNPQAVVIGADTLVAHGEDILGKPGDEKAAREMLKRFSGSDIEVFTGLAVIDGKTGKMAIGVDRSELNVVPLSENEVDRFFPIMGPYDKAGGFTMEGPGAMLFDDIKGSYFNILGLPMMKLRMMFSEVGLDILDFVKHK
jgi:septum formation protein